MTGLGSGWNMPPGCYSVPGDEPCFCEMCGRSVDNDECICPECPKCGEIGNPDCYTRIVTHHKGTYDRKTGKRYEDTTTELVTGTCDLKESEDQVESRAQVEREMEEFNRAENEYWERERLEREKRKAEGKDEDDWYW